MQPTIEAELAGARRLLAPLAADADLGADVISQLDAVMRILERLERSSARLLPYLAADNARTAELLRDIAPQLPADLEADVDRLARDGPRAHDPSVFDVSVVNTRNQALRGLLTRAVAASPPLRGKVVACLRQSLEERPW